MNIAHKSRFMLRDRLAGLGYSCQEFSWGEKEFMLFTSPAGKIWLTRSARLSYPFVTPAVEFISKHKHVAYAFAAEHGIRIPATLHLPRQADELNTFAKKHRLLIVKPIDSYSSHGMTMDITDENQLDKAIGNAKEFNAEVLVQEQCTGQEVRFTVVNGKTVHCLLRETPRVVGDGISTVSQLIAAENKARNALQFDIVPYPRLDKSNIPASFLTNKEVLPDGEVLELGRTTLVNDGASMREITSDVHSGYKAAAEKLAAELNPEFLVVDFLIDDYRQPLSDHNYAFLEFNTAPSLRIYYDVRSGTDYDIVGTLAGMIDNNEHEEV